MAKSSHSSTTSSGGKENKLSLILHAVGLIVLYSLYGVLQEKIMRTEYGPDNARFTSSPLLVLFNRIFSTTFGILITLFVNRRSHPLLPSNPSGSPSAASSLSLFLSPRALLHVLKPACAHSAYASVAIFNFLATTCQYEALKHVSFTTQSLAKTAKMVPVLVVSRLIYKKTHKNREWAAASVVLLGCFTYMTSSPNALPQKHKTSAPPALGEGSSDGAMSLSTLLGGLLLLGYLFFDGLTSTFQERVFGNSKSAGSSTSSNPFAPNSPVLDQMIWTNFFASSISMIICIVSEVTTGSVLPNLFMLLSEPSLLFDVLMLSFTTASGLVVLLSTISLFGALTSSTIMTVRQFLSILLNAGVFGNFWSVGAQGWLGVGWVASGLWIKMNRKYDPPSSGPKASPNNESVSSPSVASGSGTTTRMGPTPKVVINEKQVMFDGEGREDESRASLLDNASPGVTGSSSREDDYFKGAPTSKEPRRSIFRQYIMPLLVPLGLAFILSFFTSSSLPNPFKTAFGDHTVDGGFWAHELHTGIVDSCPKPLPRDDPENNPWTTTYSQNLTIPLTGLFTFPRSGNSYIRSMIEDATGYRTSSIYCDPVLRKTFLGECDHHERWLVKTHYPVLTGDTEEEYWQKFDRGVQLVRNPLDATFSFWHFMHSPRDADGHHNHSARVDIDKLGAEQWSQMESLAEKWQEHSSYWSKAPIYKHNLRYEDLRNNPLPSLMSLLTFMLPSNALPSLKDLACSLGPSDGPYFSRKSPFFSSWDRFEPDLRDMILEKTKEGWCRWGYDQLLKEAGLEGGPDCKSLSRPSLYEDDFHKTRMKMSTKSKSRPH